MARGVQVERESGMTLSSRRCWDRPCPQMRSPEPRPGVHTEDSMRRAQGTHSPGSSPSPAASMLGDLGHVNDLSAPQFPVCAVGRKGGDPLLQGCWQGQR